MRSDPLADHPDHPGCAYRRVHDVAVYGAGWAGLAAVAALAEAGGRPLLIAPDAAFAWEAGWAMADEPDGREHGGEAWLRLLRILRAAGAIVEGRIDGAIAEIAIAGWLRAERVPVLAYQRAYAVERDGDDAVGAVLVGGKGGARRVRARRWIDASEEGELARLAGAGAVRAGIAGRAAYAHLRHERWDSDRALAVGPGAALAAAGWPNQRTLRVELGDEPMRPRLHAALAALRATGGAAAAAVVTHSSVVPLTAWAGGGSARGVPANLALAAPGLARAPVASAPARAALGADAAEAVLRQPAARAAGPDSPLAWPAGEDAAVDVVVAGLGTGGALAALAAARAGARVLALEPLPFCGGIGSGGGIHWYYFGVKGGLQEELDARVRALQPLYAPAGSIQGFHPDAKKAALEGLLDEAGVARRHGALLVDAAASGRRITGALAATPAGALRVAAPAWIDATGDGDLVAAAGARCRVGRPGDGLLHAFTQSGGRAAAKAEGAAWMGVVNFDAGHVDPLDAEDLTRARLTGIALLAQERYDAVERPTYVAPALGLRQGRHVVCDYAPTLADLIERRRFPDAIGATGSHYDNHAVDLEFEGDEAMFWCWACRGWNARTAGWIPYRALIPADLDNAWVACRAVGVEGDAHHSLRMQRDVQRIGEAAGIAAAWAATRGAGARDVPFPALAAALRASGALAPSSEAHEDAFGPATGSTDAETRAGAELAADLAALADDALAGAALWRLYRRGPAAADALAALLADPARSWRAAAALAMLGDRRAAPRLAAAIEARETGFAEGAKASPASDAHLVPHWRASIALLRRCGDAGCAPALAGAAEDASYPVRTAIALTIERLAARGGREARAAFAPILDRLLAAPPPEPRHPQDNGEGARRSQEARRGGSSPTGPRPVREDYGWQLGVVAARARRALGLPAAAPAALLEDERAYVRSAARSAGGAASASG